MRTASLTASVVVLAAGSVASGAMMVRPAVDPAGSSTFATMSGADGQSIDGSRWFSTDGGQAVQTYWRNQRLQFTQDLPDDNWRFGVTARNFGNLPDSYTHFSVDVFTNGDFLRNVQLPAIPGEYRTTWFDLGEQAGSTDVMLVWKNDYWRPGVYDANIVIGAVQFGHQRVVPSPSGLGTLVAMGILVSRRRR